MMSVDVIGTSQRQPFGGNTVRPKQKAPDFGEGAIFRRIWLPARSNGAVEVKAPALPRIVNEAITPRT